jgi:hypothetical protein
VKAGRPSDNGEPPAYNQNRALVTWKDGPPTHVSEEIVRIDLNIYRHVRCAGCKHRGLAVKPQHCGNPYRILGTCPNCLKTEEY